MRISWWTRPITLAFALLGLVAVSAPIAAQTIVINEVVAKNTRSLMDVDGQFPDWLELYNDSDEIISLEGWGLTDSSDSPLKWVFPAVEMPPKGFLIVFCSLKDQRDPEGELHANFKLASAGEYVGLHRPDGALEDQIAPFYPAQYPDVSYGRRQLTEETVLVPLGVEMRYHVPADGSLGLSWTETDFNDAGWALGAGGIGFDSKSVPTFADLIGTDIDEVMRGKNASMYARVSFNVTDGEPVDLLSLRIHYEDGFAAYLNGQEVARDRAPTVLEHNSRATASRSSADVIAGDSFVLADHQTLLRPGQNVLAIHGLNNGVSSTDFVVHPAIDSVAFVESGGRVLEYFEVPSPGLPNGQGSPSLATPPVGSVESGIVTEPFLLELTSPDGGEIRFTRQDQVPDQDSELYTQPISIDVSTRIRAKAFVPGLISSPMAEFYFPVVEESVAAFDSDLPVLLIETFGRPIPGEPKVSGYVHVIDVDPETGRSQLMSPPHYSGPMGIEGRGSSTAGRTKKSYSLELRDRNGDDFDFPLLGMPTESDWVLYGPLNFDRAMIRNPFVYEVSNQIGTYAVRTQFVEIFVNLNADTINRSSDYYGVYVFMEKIKRGPERVDVDELLATTRDEPDISGGYILKIDRPGPGDTGFTGARQAMQHVYPREEELPQHQLDWVTGYFNEFGNALFGINYADPVNGYAKYIDVDNWIDFHILNEFTKNPDGFVLSTYFHKPRNGPITMGPVWDFDRTMGNDDDARALNPIGWSSARTHNWWGRLLTDINFSNRYKLRWQELRAGVFETGNLHAIVDSMADELREAQARNFARWTGLVTGTQGWENEIQQLKTWIERRAEWMDTQLFSPPVVEPPGGKVDLPLSVDISNPSSRGEIYYTMNGPDPKQLNLKVDPAAILHVGQPLVFNETTRLRVRIRIGEKVWSDLIEEVYFSDLPSIALTEIMYDPSNGSSFEFLEFHNYGDEPVRIFESQMTRGVLLDSINEGPEFLDPGEYTVIVNDLESFQARYDTTSINISGEYSAVLSNTGEIVALQGSLGEPVFEFRYQSAWHPSTAGGGHSLVLIDPSTPRDEYEDPSKWRPSFFSGGSPGMEDPVELPAGGQIPGDVNQDARLNISDALRLVTLVFEVADGYPCQNGRAMDTSNILVFDSNSDFRIDASDVVTVLLYLFADGAPPAQGVNCIEIRDCPEVCETAG